MLNGKIFTISIRSLPFTQKRLKDILLFFYRLYHITFGWFTIMMISKTCAYAIRAMVFIAKNGTENNKVGIREVARGISSPEPFTAKILQDLSRKGLIDSVKGPHGGFYITGNLRKVSMADIVLAIDGEGIFTACGLGLKACSEVNPCPIHHTYKPIRQEVRRMLEQATMESFMLTEGID